MPAKDRKAYAQAHYQANKEKYRASSRKSLLKRKQIVWDFKDRKCQGTGCAVQLPPQCMDLHHRDPAKKEGHISKLVRTATEDELRVELQKCDVLCPNCHRLLHFKERPE